jgi:hypothetical protein
MANLKIIIFVSYIAANCNIFYSVCLRSRSWVPGPRAKLSTTDFFQKRSKLPCLRAYISQNLLIDPELNKKRLKNLLNNFLCSFQIRKDPTSDILGTLIKISSQTGPIDPFVKLSDVVRKPCTGDSDYCTIKPGFHIWS